MPEVWTTPTCRGRSTRHRERPTGTSPLVMAISDGILQVLLASTRTRRRPLYHNAFLPTSPTTSLVMWRPVHCRRLVDHPTNRYDEHPPLPRRLAPGSSTRYSKTLVSNGTCGRRPVLFVHVRRERRILSIMWLHRSSRGNSGRVPHHRPCRRSPMKLPVPSLGSRVPDAGRLSVQSRRLMSPRGLRHTSQLRFLEERFDVRAPNISTWRPQARSGTSRRRCRWARPRPSVPVLPSTFADTPARWSHHSA